jgi:hypothetical protein
MNKILLTLFASALATTMAAQQSARVVTHIVKNASPEWKTWKADACSMNYPGAWTVTYGEGDTVAEFRSPANPEQALLTVVSRPLAGIDAAGFHRGFGPGQYDGSATTKVLDASGPDAKGGYSFSYVSAVEGAPLWQRQDVVMANGTAWLLTYSGDEHSYAENLYMAEAMINSFTAAGK